MDYATYLRELAKLPVDAPLMLEHLRTAEEYEEGKRYIHECKDAKSETGYSLLTYVEATHAALEIFIREEANYRTAVHWAVADRQFQAAFEKAGFRPTYQEMVLPL